MRDIICIGASAGGVEALTKVVGGFPPDLPASVFVVLHIPPYQPSRLFEILDRAGPLKAVAAEDGDRFMKSRIYIAPPDYHIMLEGGRIRVIKGPKECRFRPAIDPLFRSAAQHYARRSIGVLLSGVLDDGTAGLWALKRSGGIAVVQDLDDALFPEMPRNAIQHIDVDYTSVAAGMGSLLTRLVREPPGTEKPSLKVAEVMRIENEYTKLKEVPRKTLEQIGKPVSLICPICNGPLWQLKEGPRRYRCHTGHAFTPATLFEEHRERSEQSLAMLITLFDDEVTLSKLVLETSTSPEQSRRITRDIREAEQRAATLRKLLSGDVGLPREKKTAPVPD